MRRPYEQILQKILAQHKTKFIYNTLNEAIGKQSFPPFLRVEIVTLIPIPKSPYELSYIKNWRPITLLNTDYKIFTKRIGVFRLVEAPTTMSYLCAW